jgi:thiol-disulfide isomerase/thioredoxin
MNFASLLLLITFLTISYCSKSQVSKDQIKLNTLHKKTETIRDTLGFYYQSYYAKIKATDDTLEKRGYQNKIDSLDKLTDINNNEELLIDLKFVKTHLSSPISLNALLYRLKRREGLNYYKEIYSLFNSLNPELKKTEKGVELKEALLNFKNSSVGEMAPDFSVEDINSNELVLSSFRNKKYVLLDFWASWCVPCRQDFSFMKDIYKKYNSKDLEIINISRDENTELWKKAIENDSIGMWRHFSLKENKSSVEKLFFVTAIPVKILINKEGIIIGRWRGGGEENISEIRKSLRQTFME